MKSQIFLYYICRPLGVISIFVLWASTFRFVSKGHLFSVYLVTVSCMITFLETIFVIRHLFHLFCKDGCSGCSNVYNRLQTLDGWRKSFLYCILSSLCFINLRQQALLSGSSLFALAILYGIFEMLLIFDERKEMNVTRNVHVESNLEEDVVFDRQRSTAG